VIGLAVGACGVAFLAGPGAGNLGDSSTLAMVGVIAATISYAVAAVYSRSVLRFTDPIELSAVKFALASAVLLPFVSLREGVGSFAELGLTGWASLAGIGLVVTGLARCGYVWVIKTAGSVSASLLTYIVPASALGLGFVFMEESMSWARAMGILLVGISVTSTLFGPRLVRLVGLESARQFARLRALRSLERVRVPPDQ
jgi:drug/metabolite transporter (DMT)-like permease